MSLLRGIYSYGYEKPSFIQQKCIFPMINGKDILAESQSGTGKTACYSISLLQIIDEEIFTMNEAQGLILSPTRELAQQINLNISQIGEYMRAKVHSFIGGTSLKGDIASLVNGVHIVVGTPGRILDLLQKKIISLSKLKVFIIDEADEMLSRGFLLTIKKIISYLQANIQVGVFSATFKSKDILDIAESILKDPIKVHVNKSEEKFSLEEIKQFYIKVANDDKINKLLSLYRQIDISQSFIYCNNITTVDYLSEELKSRGFAISTIHSDFNQSERDKQLKNFRSGLSRIMVTSDLLARGIDICQLDMVINYDLPINPETYIHRIGRTGRFGKKGISFSLVSDNDLSCIDDIKSISQSEMIEYIV